MGPVSSACVFCGTKPSEEFVLLFHYKDGKICDLSDRVSGEKDECRLRIRTCPHCKDVLLGKSHYLDEHRSGWVLFGAWLAFLALCIYLVLKLDLVDEIGAIVLAIVFLGVPTSLIAAMLVDWIVGVFMWMPKKRKHDDFIRLLKNNYDVDAVLAATQAEIKTNRERFYAEKIRNDITHVISDSDDDVLRLLDNADSFDDVKNLFEMHFDVAPHSVQTYIVAKMIEMAYASNWKDVSMVKHLLANVEWAHDEIVAKELSQLRSLVRLFLIVLLLFIVLCCVTYLLCKSNINGWGIVSIIASAFFFEKTCVCFVNLVNAFASFRQAKAMQTK